MPEEPVMPLTAKGREIMANMRKQYGPEAGERVFYASKNKGVISGVDSDEPDVPIPADYGTKLDAVADAAEKLMVRLGAYEDRNRADNAEDDIRAVLKKLTTKAGPEEHIDARSVLEALPPGDYSLSTVRRVLDKIGSKHSSGAGRGRFVGYRDASDVEAERRGVTIAGHTGEMVR